MTYQTYKVNLTNFQKKKLANAVKLKKAINLKLSHKDLSGDIPLLLTQTQLNKIKKSHEKGIGLVLKLSEKQIHEFHKTGGFLGTLFTKIAPFLLKTLATGALGGLADWGVKKVADSVAGSGLDGIQIKSPSIGYKKKNMGMGMEMKGNGLFPMGV